MITRWVLTATILLTLFKSTSWANEITIEQIGDNLDLTIVQKGGNNVVKQYVYTSELAGDDMTVEFHQEHSDGTSNNVIEYWHVEGNNNSVEVRQGSDNLGGNGVRSDSEEYSGHYARVDIHGNDNSIRIGQRNPDNSPHTAVANIWYVDDSSIEITQGSSGSKTAHATIQNEGSSITVIQDGNGQHQSYIDTYGTQPSTIDLTQGGSTSQFYSLSQNCMTTGGCSVSVIQN